jgi:hypothetical protein
MRFASNKKSKTMVEMSGMVDFQCYRTVSLRYNDICINKYLVE